MRKFKVRSIQLLLVAGTMVAAMSACDSEAPDGTSSTDSNIVAGAPTPTPAPTPTSTVTPVPTPTPTLPPAQTMQEDVFNRTNAYRLANGVPALTMNEKLSAAAQAHADAMASSGFFSHTSLDGSNAGDRISAQGYDWSTWGENIAYGYTTAEGVMNGWINSAGHRANILSSKFKELGVGYAINAKGTPYWVQDFGTQ